jgi:hypothetical protein
MTFMYFRRKIPCYRVNARLSPSTPRTPLTTYKSIWHMLSWPLLQPVAPYTAALPHTAALPDSRKLPRTLPHTATHCHICACMHACTTAHHCAHCRTLPHNAALPHSCTLPRVNCDIMIIINMLMPASSDCFTHLRALLVLQEPRH